MKNQIVSEGITIIDNEHTALAGCSNDACGLDCMRKDERLIYQRVDLRAEQNNPVCKFFIPY